MYFGYMEILRAFSLTVYEIIKKIKTSYFKTKNNKIAPF